MRDTGIVCGWFGGGAYVFFLDIFIALHLGIWTLHHLRFQLNQRSD